MKELAEYNKKMHEIRVNFQKEVKVTVAKTETSNENAKEASAKISSQEEAKNKLEAFAQQQK